MAHTTLLIVLCLGIAGGIAGGFLGGLRAKKKYQMNKKFSKAQKEKMKE